MAGEGELVLGFILIIVFFATLTIKDIPIIWTGALIGGIISIISGLWKMLKSSGSPQTQPSRLPPPPPPDEVWNYLKNLEAEGMDITSHFKEEVMRMLASKFKGVNPSTLYAAYVQYIAESKQKQNYSLSAPQPPPPPPPETLSWSSNQRESVSWASTWGELCDALIREKGRAHFQNEYTPEMIKAYDKGVLHVVPSLHNSLVTTCADQRQLLSFVDTTNYWVLGYLISRGPLSTSPEIRTRVHDFLKHLLPPFLRSELAAEAGKRSGPPEGVDVVLKKEKAPNFLVQTRFMNVLYNIFECISEDQAKSFVTLTAETIEQFAQKKLANLMVKFFPVLQPEEIEQATGFIVINGEQIFVSRRLIPRVFPDAPGPHKGGFALDYLMRWQHENMLFYLYEPNALKYAEYDEKEKIRYDPQVLKKALTNFDGQQIYKNGLTMLEVFTKNRQWLKTSSE
jgi:hypothetical protein